MSFLASDVITAARAIWKESTPGDILSDELCWEFLNLGITRIRSRRTDSTFDSNGNHVDALVVSANSSLINLDSVFLPMLTEYLIARGFQSDADSQNHDKRSSVHMNEFENQLKGA